MGSDFRKQRCGNGMLQSPSAWTNLGKQLLPNEVAREDVAQRNYYEKHGSVLLVDYVQKELEKKNVLWWKPNIGLR